MDRLDEMRLFVAAVEAGSLAAAGRRLGHSPPAMTRTLAALEARLGVRLLDEEVFEIASLDPEHPLTEHKSKGVAKALSRHGMFDEINVEPCDEEQGED